MVINEVVAVELLKQCLKLFDEAHPKFNWRDSCLDANAIKLLNEVPSNVRMFLKDIGEIK